MLRDAVRRFGEDLKKISEIITTKSMYVNMTQAFRNTKPFKQTKPWPNTFQCEMILSFCRGQIKSALKQRVYEQNCTEPDLSKKTPQKRSANNNSEPTDEVMAKKIKQGFYLFLADYVINRFITYKQKQDDDFNVLIF